MTATAFDALQRVGLPEEEVRAWRERAVEAGECYEQAIAGLSAFVQAGRALQARLPEPGHRSQDEREAAQALQEVLTAARVAFLEAHVERLHDELTDDRARPVRLEELLTGACRRVPGLVPDCGALAAERARPLSEKHGHELAQALFASHVLASPRAGSHLVESMLAPRPESLERLEELQATGSIDLGHARVTRRGRAGVLEICNPRHLNAEDSETLPPTEIAVDLVLLDDEIEVGVLRGGPTDHPRYAGERVFGAGINLTHLYQGRIEFLFYLVRDLGYVSKIYRGLQGGPEKLWVAAVERYAIGGACQLLHVVDHVLATRGARLYLPARREGIIPGASNLRLARAVGDRAARQAILSGREWVAGDADAAALVDEVVEPSPEAVEAAIDARVGALTGSGVINAAANRRAMRIGAEPLDTFRRYMALYAREQAYCHLSPALVSNLERHWKRASRAAH